jgi:hypothetical protein
MDRRASKPEIKKVVAAGLSMVDLIESVRSPRGGFTRAGLANLGVPWPPPKGWRKRLLARGILINPKAGVPARTPTIKNYGPRIEGMARREAALRSPVERPLHAMPDGDRHDLDRLYTRSELRWETEWYEIGDCVGP